MKKRFSIQTILNKFKKLVAKIKQEEIWMPNEKHKPMKMNESFVLMYLLKNSDDHLKI